MPVPKKGHTCRIKTFFKETKKTIVEVSEGECNESV